MKLVEREKTKEELLALQYTDESTFFIKFA